MTQDELRQGPSEAEHRLVLLHGWGADADDLMDLGEQLAGEEIELVALRAPEPHPMGVGRQWYDLQQPEWPGLVPARESLRQRLLALGDSLPLERTAVLGFSQGAAMALDVASGLPIAGLIACSGYPHPGWAPAGPLSRVLLTHGDQDPVVPPAASAEVLRLLRQGGGWAELLTFAGGHTIDASLFAPMRAFLAQWWTPAPGPT